MAFARGRLQGLGSTAVCRNMERLKYESAGELTVLREMRGRTEERRQEKAIDNTNQALRVGVIGWRCSSGGSVSAQGCYSWEPHLVDWTTPSNPIHSVIMPNAGNTMKKKEKSKEKEAEHGQHMYAF